LKLIERVGIHVVKAVLVKNIDETLEKSKKVGFPMVVKVYN
jgi:carbamoylphosphate synthase large subunit